MKYMVSTKAKIFQPMTRQEAVEMIIRLEAAGSKCTLWRKGKYPEYSSC